MAKTNRKESRKIYEGYKKRQRLWNTIFIVFFAVIGIGSAVLNGTMELDPQIVIGKYEFTWFHLVILAVLVVLLGFGMNLSSVLQVGGQSLPIIVSTIATSLIVAFALYKALHMDSNIVCTGE